MRSAGARQFLCVNPAIPHNSQHPVSSSLNAHSSSTATTFLLFPKNLVTELLQRSSSPPPTSPPRSPCAALFRIHLRKPFALRNLPRAAAPPNRQTLARSTRADRSSASTPPQNAPPSPASRW